MATTLVAILQPSQTSTLMSKLLRAACSDNVVSPHIKLPHHSKQQYFERMLGLCQFGLDFWKPEESCTCFPQRLTRHLCRFKAFHERYYHPSNGRFWFYGDDPPQERLRLLADFLDNFEARPVDSTVKPQPLFSVCTLLAALCFTMLQDARHCGETGAL